MTPDIVICSVGTEVFYRDSDGRYRPDTQWRQQLDAGGRWDRDKVQRVAQGYAHLTPQVRAAPPWAPLWLLLPWQQLAANAVACSLLVACSLVIVWQAAAVSWPSTEHPHSVGAYASVVLVAL